MPDVTVRDVVERTGTVETGINILTGADSEWVLRSMQIALDTPHDWAPPAECMVPDVARTVGMIVLGYTHGLELM
ncbi:MAG: hypothetical protein NTV38_00325 [Chloroflexi bacterium]|nr:hypothetical protein [Chloroflexota bacterium]